MQSEVPNTTNPLAYLPETYLANSVCPTEYPTAYSKYLGYKQSPAAVAFNIQSLKDCPVPKTITELQQFLGYANYYSNSFRSFAYIALFVSKLL